MMMWYDDPEVHTVMQAMGLSEVETGTWMSQDKMRSVIDFPGGTIILTRLLSEKPEFDVQTIHKGDGRDAGWLNQCFIDHMEEMKTRTEAIKARGTSAGKKAPAS